MAKEKVMKKYEALVIGASFAAVGFALGRKNTLIVEKTEILDTEFYLPMVGFEYERYEPVTDLGKEFLEIFDSHALFRGGMQSVNAFEIALCRFSEKHPTDIYLKCRVIDIKKSDGGYTVKLIHNGGIETVEVAQILDCSTPGMGYHTLTVLFHAEDGADPCAVKEVFPGAVVESAFYSGRYSVRIPISIDDINDAKCYVYDKWQALDGHKIIYIAPAFHYTEHTNPIFGCSKNPIEAFERGLRMGWEEKK
jgi:hypothetical protein